MSDWFEACVQTLRTAHPELGPRSAQYVVGRLSALILSRLEEPLRIRMLAASAWAADIRVSGPVDTTVGLPQLVEAAEYAVLISGTLAGDRAASLAPALVETYLRFFHQPLPEELARECLASLPAELRNRAASRASETRSLAA